MQTVWFFLLIFCAVFGAAELLRVMYRALISRFSRIYDRRERERNRRT